MIISTIRDTSPEPRHVKFVKSKQRKPDVASPKKFRPRSPGGSQNNSSSELKSFETEELAELAEELLEEAKDDKPYSQRPLFPNEGNFIEKIFLLFEDPSASKSSTIMSVFVLILIVISSCGFIIQTLPQYKYPIYVGPTRDSVPPIFEYIEFTSMTLFGIEYFTRLAITPCCSYEVLKMSPEYTNYFTCCCIRPKLAPLKKAGNWFFRTMNIVDFLAILPFYLKVITDKPGIFDLGYLRILRLARVFRVFKVGKFSEGLSLYYAVLKASSSAFKLLLFFSCLTAVVFGSLLYELEHGDFDPTDGRWYRPDVAGSGRQISPFYSIPQCFWWCFTTMSTVGYGDLAPTSPVGKVVTILCMHVGILAFAMPITIIGSNFSRMYEMKVKLMMEKAAEADQSGMFLEKHIQNLEATIEKIGKIKLEVKNNARELEIFTQRLSKERPEIVKALEDTSRAMINDILEDTNSWEAACEKQSKNKNPQLKKCHTTYG